MDNKELAKMIQELTFQQVSQMAYIEALIEDYSELITSSPKDKQNVYTRIMVNAELKIEELRNRKT